MKQLRPQIESNDGTYGNYVKSPFNVNTIHDNNRTQMELGQKE